ncbi:hypothetical protein BJ166DRAFT_532417 [Pestalotiopsis sp. NC0098]|nr:hypothetical protein BJ166DRAFT_532417 [Pestalotiopsis sp. NC0098]
MRLTVKCFEPLLVLRFSHVVTLSGSDCSRPCAVLGVCIGFCPKDAKLPLENKISNSDDIKTRAILSNLFELSL